MLLDVMAGQIPNRLDRERPPADLDFVAFHGFLNGGAHVTDPHVDSGGLRWLSALHSASNVVPSASHLNTGVGGVLDRREEVVVSVVERHGKRTVNNPSIDVHPEVHRENVLLLQNNILMAWVRRIMRDLMVHAQAGGEAEAGFAAISRLQPGIPQQRPHGSLNARGDVLEGVTRSDGLLDPSSSLAVGLSSLAIVLSELVVFPMPPALKPNLRASRPLRSLADVRVFLQLTLRVVARWEEVTQRNSRRRGLLHTRFRRASLLRPLLSFLTFLRRDYRPVGGQTSGRRCFSYLASMIVSVAVIIVVVVVEISEAAIPVPSCVRTTRFSARASNLTRAGGKP